MTLLLEEGETRAVPRTQLAYTAGLMLGAAMILQDTRPDTAKLLMKASVQLYPEAAKYVPSTPAHGDDDGD